MLSTFLQDFAQGVGLLGAGDLGQEASDLDGLGLGLEPGQGALVGRPHAQVVVLVVDPGPTGELERTSWGRLRVRIGML